MPPFPAHFSGSLQVLSQQLQAILWIVKPHVSNLREQQCCISTTAGESNHINLLSKLVIALSRIAERFSSFSPSVYSQLLKVFGIIFF